jgi:hypothetical protein
MALRRLTMDDLDALGMSLEREAEIDGEPTLVYSAARPSG